MKVEQVAKRVDQHVLSIARILMIFKHERQYTTPPFWTGEKKWKKVLEVVHTF